MSSKSDRNLLAPEGAVNIMKNLLTRLRDRYTSNSRYTILDVLADH